MTNMFGNTPTKEEIEQLTEARDTILNSKNNSQIELEQVQAKLADVITELDTQKDILVTYRRDVDALKEEKNILLEETSDLEQVVRSTKASIKSLEATEQYAQKSILELIDEKEHLFSSIKDDVAEKRAEADSIIMALDEEIVSRENKANEMHDKIEILKKEWQSEVDKFRELVKNTGEETNTLENIKSEIIVANEQLTKTKLQIVEQKEAQAKNLIDIEAAINALKEQKTIMLEALKEETEKLADIQKESDEVADGLKNHRQVIINLNRKEERIRDFCDENGIDHSKL